MRRATSKIQFFFCEQRISQKERPRVHESRPRDPAQKQLTRRVRGAAWHVYAGFRSPSRDGRSPRASTLRTCTHGATSAKVSTLGGMVHCTNDRRSNLLAQRISDVLTPVKEGPGSGKSRLSSGSFSCERIAAVEGVILSTIGTEEWEQGSTKSTGLLSPMRVVLPPDAPAAAPAAFARGHRQEPRAGPLQGARVLARPRPMHDDHRHRLLSLQLSLMMITAIAFFPFNFLCSGARAPPRPALPPAPGAARCGAAPDVRRVTRGQSFCVTRPRTTGRATCGAFRGCDRLTPRVTARQRRGDPHRGLYALPPPLGARPCPLPPNTPR